MDRTPLQTLEQHDDFISRHIGPRDSDIQAMLDTIGVESLDALIVRAVPSGLRSDTPLDLPPARREDDVLAELRAMAGQNTVLRSMIGMGYYDCFTPGVILRNVLENPGWYTAYTPYQPEISQGRLEALLNFQTMVMDLTGMEMANASLLDEATAAAEAMTLCRRVGKKKSDSFFVSDACHTQTIDVLRTRAAPLGISLIVGDVRTDLADADPFGILLQYPASDGAVEDYADVVATAHDAGALVTVAADLLALTLLTPPGEWDADVVVGSAQRFGVPMGCGGPHAAFLATREAYRRSIPGRLVGVSIDMAGRPALRLALQTREQHIRREKATSNICTAQVLLAVMAGLYAVYHGPERLETIARRVHRLTSVAAAGLRGLGFDMANDSWFDTLCVRAPGAASSLLTKARTEGYNFRQIDDGTLGLSFDETTTTDDIAAVLRIFGGDGSVGETDTGVEDDAIPSALRRTSPFLTHPVFNSYHSETEMLRYLKRLQDKDIALDRSMIPLGSCTMKLNATTEMAPVTWPEFGRIHPFAPDDQLVGYRTLIEGLEVMLCRATGFDAVSFQPNAGSQGEYAGLLVIRAYHESRGEGGRDICLIPSSAHGTNPASAVMAGLKVVVVDCDDHGNIDVDDLKAKAETHADALAALMVTYPSTHGVFEEPIRDICAIVHDNGGQVYLDGANLNAMLGVCYPADFGADVSHMNLHKTFCIPHGGGGPGMGPIGVQAHLAPFLPSHHTQPMADEAVGAIAAAPWGSPSILTISWAYIAMMGGNGLRRATELAILNANYIAHRLNPYFPVLYTGPGGLVAHECIVDLRRLEGDISIDDVAKRLVDFGIHAPTMSFPVADTLMIEPTESESKTEIDRFCDAMIAVHGEIARVESGALDREDNPLRNAPHTLEDVVNDSWAHAYSREEAAFPSAATRENKYWPPVGRIDQVYGDRNFVCACPPLDAYRDAAD
ncbi:MAG: aminomethyl-transferring glycine dehydrogenase [Alphaproteobacteria bacterium]|nr:aminomethyl-transferring glycine dehydrogenase [Alphaproteobacteria bacterium]